MELAEGTVVADRFRLVRELGQGGMGSVWFAHHTGLDIPCAVKFIHAEVAALPEIRARFEREAKAAAQLRSPNVVQVLDYGVSEGIPYIAMEFLEGEDLAVRLKRMGRLAPHETASVVGQVARALVKAHAAGLVHRDLKPENIFLVHDDDREIAKVLDFGIAKSNQASVAGDSATKTGSLLGTPHYMSPEQAQGTKAVDFRSDLWALAVIAYRCMTGRLPFESEALGDLLVKIIVNPIPTPSQIAPGIPPTFDAWWIRAAQRDPAQRFQSAKDLADSLAVALGISSHLGGAPSIGRPVHEAVGPTVLGAPASVIPTPAQGGYGPGGVAFPTPAPVPAGPTVPQQPYQSYGGQGGYPSAPGVGQAPVGATHASGYTPMPAGAAPVAPTAVGSYGGTSASPAGVPHTTNPAVSTTMTGVPQVAAPPAGRGKLIGVIAALGVVAGIGVTVVVMKSSGSAHGTEPAASIAPPPAPPSAASVAADPTVTAPSAEPTTEPAPPEPPAATAPAKPGAKGPPPPPATHRPPVTPPPPPPPPTRTGKVVIPPSPPPGGKKDFGF